MSAEPNEADLSQLSLEEQSKVLLTERDRLQASFAKKQADTLRARHDLANWTSEVTLAEYKRQFAEREQIRAELERLRAEFERLQQRRIRDGLPPIDLDNLP